VTLVVHDEGDRPTEPQVLSVAAGPRNARARLIALTLVELMSGPSSERRSTSGRTEPAARAARTSGVVAQPARATRNPLVLAAHLGSRRYPDSGLLIGGGIAARRGGRFGWRADLEVHRGEGDVSLGSVATTVADGGSYLDVALVRARVRVGAHAGARGGVARLVGKPASAGSTAGHVTGAWWGAVVGATLDVPVGTRVGLTVAAELGAVLLPVTGLVGARAESAVDGGWIAVHVGLQVIP
jgi:hypothetical protein